MATIGSLIVGIRANTGKFNKDLKRAQKNTKSFGRSVKSSLKPLGGFASAITGIGAGLSVAGIGIALSRAAENIDKIGKTARNLGIATENLVGLQHAARQTGVESATLTTGLRMMQKNIIDAKDGTGEAKVAFEKLGVSVETLARLKPEEQFSLISERMNTMKSSSEKLNSAMKIFGRSGTDLIETMSLGANGLAAMQEEAEKLGKTFSVDEAKKVEAFNDALANFKDITASIGQGLVIDISPVAATILEGFTDAWSKFNGNKVGNDAVDKTSGWFERNMPNVTELGVMLEKKLFDSGSVARRLEGGARFSQNIRGGRAADLITDKQTNEQLRKKARVQFSELAKSVKGIQAPDSVKAIGDGVFNSFKKIASGVGSTASHNKFLLDNAITKTVQANAEERNKLGASSRDRSRQNAGLFQRGSAEAFLALRAKTSGEDKSLKVQRDQLDRLDQLVENTANTNEAEFSIA